MRVDVVTLFPGMFTGPLGLGILGRARERGILDIRIHDLRRWGVGPHRQVDDAPFGGGPGMVLRPEPLFEAVDWIRSREQGRDPAPVVLLTPQGETLRPSLARELAGLPAMILLCGRYEGVDERVREALADRELSIGDFVLSGGEVAALVALDVISRFIPGVVGREGAVEEESFSRGLLDYPQYTRPANYRGLEVPPVLRSGDHRAVERWRREAALERTRRRRPDLAGPGA